MIQKIYEGSTNYTATVVEIKNITEIPGMDKIALTVIHGNTVVVSKDTQVGDVGLFFPSECVIAPEFLSANNLFKDSTLNANKTEKGYFETSGRVKSLKLVKGTVISTGFYIPIVSLSYTKLDFASLVVGNSFNKLEEFHICEKYTPKAIQNAIARSKNDKLAAKFEKLLVNQFRLHEDTSKLAMNLHRFTLNDIVAITSKVHGTSGVWANVLVKRGLRWHERLVQKLGIKIVTEEYANICASRKVIKTVEINDGEQNHFYDSDVWNQTNGKLEGLIEDGVTIYGEIVGYTSTGSSIQGMYDYGCKSPNNQLFVYRITYTTPQGKVIEFSWQQVKDYCAKYNLTHVPEYYYGKLQDFYFRFVEAQFPDDEPIDAIFKYLQTAYNMEKMCEFCSNEVPAEGLVVRRDGHSIFDAYKLKAKLFLLKESADLDKGIVDMETMESA